MIYFDEEYSSSIRLVAIEKSSKINLTTRFLNGKMLMFSKVLIKSFVYDLIDVFMFPDQETQEIYQKYQAEKCYLYQNLTDTDSTSMFFVFICNLNCSVSEEKARNIIFEVMLKSKVFDRLDLSAQFYEQFDCRNENLRKRVGFLKLKVLIRRTYFLLHEIQKNTMNVLSIIQTTKNIKGEKNLLLVWILILVLIDSPIEPNIQMSF